MRILTRVRRGPLITAIVGIVAVAVVAVIALVSPGYTTQDMELDDGSVWVPNGTQQMVGHANTQLAKLSSAITTNGSTLSLIQAPSLLIIHDRSNNTLELTDPAQAQLTTPVPLPAGNPEVLSTNKTLLIYLPDSGDAWITPIDAVASSLDAKAPATRNFGANVTAAVDSNERFAAYSAKSHQLMTGSLAAGSAAPKTRTVTFSGATANVQVSLVGGKVAIYNERTNEAWVNGKTYQLGALITRPDSAALMQSSVDGGRVLIAHDEGLVSISMDGGSPRSISSETGKAAAPVHLGDCDYAAWSGGTALRMCAAAKAVTMQLQGAGSDAALDLLANGRNVVANDGESGATWAVQRSGQLIDNWSDFIVKDSQQTTRSEQKDVPPKIDPDEKPPVAVDDEFGVRPSQANKLPVLLNDFDANGDPLVITEYSSVPGTFGSLSIVDNGQQLLLTTTPQATGTQRFTYTIDDGRGGSDTATVTVNVKGANENSAPYQARSTRTSLASGGTATVSALDDWVDPESDPIYLADATTSGADTVRFTPDGTVTFVDSGNGATSKQIAVTVSDGYKEAKGVINVTVGAKGKVPIIADSFTMTGFVGKAIKVEPLGNTRGGSGTITLNGAKATADSAAAQLSRDYENGTFTATFSQPGTHFVQYSVTDGTQTANGIVRCEIASPPRQQKAPVTAPSTAFLYLQSSEMVDVLASDYDPSGGVLSIDRVTDAPAANPRVVVEILEHRILRVTLMDPLAKPLTIHYVATNGYMETTGSLTLVNIPEPAKLQPPIARPDKAVVRAGGQVDIPVIANDTQPNNKPLILDKKLVRDVGKGNGLLFVSGDQLRYLAPEKPGEYTAEYKVSSLDGQWASAQVTITVRDLNKANNLPPVPKTVTARTTTNDKVEIPIPLSGIDPDGDRVELVGLAPSSPPALGAVTQFNQASIEYTAGPNAGTDTFQYLVQDAYGATATGTIRVGVGQAGQLGTPPIAMPDIVVVRPGTNLSVPVTDNDSDPDGGTFAIVKVDPTADIKVTHSATRVALTAPQKQGTYGIFYTIRNTRGGQSTAWLTVQVKDDAPLLSPSADDIPLTVGDIDGRTTVQVSPLTKAVHFAESSTTVLKVSLPLAPEGATVSANGRITLPIAKKSQIIPYTVTRSDDSTVSASAFIWLPGTDDAAPALRADRKALVVTSGKTLRINVADQVMAINERKVTIADPRTVQATHSDGSNPYVDSTTLSFTSATDYWGPASVSFTATDGYSKAPITLPITVKPAKDQPPVVKNTHVDLEQSGDTTINLTSITDSPQITDKSKLEFSVSNGSKSVVNASVVAGSKLSIAAIDGASVGSTAKLSVTATDPGGQTGVGLVDVTIVSSSKPLVMPVADTAAVQRGSQVSVNVLDNDEATNPFPKPLHLVSVGTTTMTGVTISMSPDRRSVTVKVAKSAETGTVSFPYEVADATNDKKRYTTGVVTVQIQDVPDAPASAPTVVVKDEPNASVTLAIPHAFPNGLPITEYVVLSYDGRELARCSNPDACKVSGLAYGQPYQFKAFAVNSLGSGAASPASETVVIDASPAAPSAVTLTQNTSDQSGGTLHGSWSPGSQPGFGTAIVGYEAALSGPDGYARTVELGSDVTSYDFAGVSPGNQYTLSVRARNKTNLGEAGTTSAIAVGPPSASGVGVTQSGMNAVMSWTITSDGGAGVGIYAAHYSGAAPSGACDPAAFSANASGNSWTDTSPQPGYSYGISVSNGVFCRSFPAGSFTLLPVTSASASVQPSGAVRDIVVNATAKFKDHFEYSLVPDGSGPGGWTTLPDSGVIQDSSAYGRASTVYVRACVSSDGSMCGAVTTAGTGLVPLRTQPTVGACLAGSQPSVTPPDNNGLTTQVQVRYTHSATGASSAWAELGKPGAVVPAAAAGDTITMTMQTVISGTTYPYLGSPVVCR